MAALPIMPVLRSVPFMVIAGHRASAPSRKELNRKMAWCRLSAPPCMPGYFKDREREGIHVKHSIQDFGGRAAVITKSLQGKSVVQRADKMNESYREL